jgi:hypothetical protein
MLCLSYAIFCKEVITSFEETSATTIRNKFSIGVDKLPWDASKISLRWWKSENRGNEFSVGYLKGNVRKKYYEDKLDVELSISEVGYYWLSRKKFNHLERFYITRGIGISSNL